MTVHLLWMWVWYVIGSLAYALKRAYYLVTGPNPIANDYTQFIKRCWAPLVVRFIADSGIYWATFTPFALQSMLAWLGWTKFSDSIAAVSNYGFFALFFGLGIDSIVDFSVTKIPWLKDWWPQMPGPLPSPAPSDKDIEREKKG